MSNRLLYAILAAVVAAMATVLVFREHAAHVYFVGQFFLNALQTLIVPLIMLSVISGVVEIGSGRKLGTLGGKSVAYYGATMLIAASLGLVVVNALGPGVGVESSGISSENAQKADDVGFKDILLKLVGSNIFESMAEMEILPIIVFSIVFGIVLSRMGEQGKPLVDLVSSANGAMMQMVHLIMLSSPIGIYGLIAGRFGEAMAKGGTDAFVEQLTAVGAYVAAVLIGLAAHAFVILPLLLWLITRRNPIAFGRGMGGALLTATATASSSATLPVTLENLIQNNGVDSRTARFVLPLGSTVNMDGSALYEAMAAMFIAQVAGIQLGLGDQIVVVLTSALAAMGAAGIPEAGLVTMIVVLRSVNLPLDGLELLLPVDWFLDRFRTATNVWGDGIGAAVLEGRPSEV